MTSTNRGEGTAAGRSIQAVDRNLLVLSLLTVAVAASLVLAPRADALVYWGNSGDGTIGRAHLDGTNAQQDFITGVSQPCGVAVDSEHIYWADFDGDRIGRANISGTGVDHNFITGVVDPCGIAVDAEHVYWSTCSSTGAIGRADLDGTGVNQDFVPATATDGPCGVGVDAEHVYWANCESPGSIGRADIDGSDPNETFITGTDLPCGEIAVNSSFIYWTNSGSPDTVARADIDGSDPDQDFITGLSEGFGVAVDATHLYWVNFSSDAIGRATLGGANVQQSFIGANNPQGIAVDSLSSFPLPSNDFSFGKVKRNKKKGAATLTVEVPSAGTVALAGKGIKKQEKDASGAGEVKLKVRAKGGKKRKLEEAGKVKVKAKVTYAPTGGEPNTKSKRIKLLKQL